MPIRYSPEERRKPTEEQGWVEGWLLGLMEEQKGLELSKGLGERGGEVSGETRRGGAGGAGQGSGAPGGVTGSSVTCPPLTEAICCRERQRR